MIETQDKTKSYEEQRLFLGTMSLRDRRLSMNQSMGLTEAEDEVLKQLNGHSGTPLTKYLEENLYRLPENLRPYFH